MDKIGVLLVDDQVILRYGLRVYLSSVDDIAITGEASNEKECLECCEKNEPDICLLDIKLPEVSGLEAAKRLKQSFPDVKILAFSTLLSHQGLKQALHIGIDGYLLKTEPKESIPESIRSVAGGNSVFSDEVSQMINQSIVNIHSNGRYEQNVTSREKEILSLVVEGYSSAQIGEKLFISPRTVEKHRSNLMEKLEVHNTAALVRRALKDGFVAVAQ